MCVMAQADFETGHRSNDELYFEVHTSQERSKYIIPNLSNCEVFGNWIVFEIIQVGELGPQTTLLCWKR